MNIGACYQIPNMFIYEPTHEIMALIALRKHNLQTRMRSNPLGLHVWFLVRSFVYFHTLFVRTAKALARLRGCAVSPEHSLFAYAISTKSHVLAHICYVIYDANKILFTPRLARCKNSSLVLLLTVLRRCLWWFIALFCEYTVTVSLPRVGNGAIVRRLEPRSGCKFGLYVCVRQCNAWVRESLCALNKIMSGSIEHRAIP